MYFRKNADTECVLSNLKFNLYELCVIYESLDNLENFVESFLPTVEDELFFELSKDVSKLKSKIRKEIDTL